jgi:hypothetical protein
MPVEMSSTRGKDCNCKAKRHRIGELRLNLKKNEGLILSSLYATIQLTRAAADAIGHK